jgi:hypothetical protein
MVRTLYKKLLRLYPHEFRERLGESMEQTFDDLYNEKSRGGSFLLWVFMETILGILREHVLFISQGGTMKRILTSPGYAGMISLILSLPLAIIYLSYMSDIDALTTPLDRWFTIQGQPGDINILGRIVILGGLLLLPVAFLLNLQPVLKRDQDDGKPTLHMINLVVGVMLLLLITLTWGGLLVQEIQCMQGILCD